MELKPISEPSLGDFKEKIWINISQASVKLGEVVHYSWGSEYLKALIIKKYRDGTYLGAKAVATSGSSSFIPDKPGTYKLVISGVSVLHGTTHKDDDSVVVGVPLPEIISFDVSPATVKKGESVRISFEAHGKVTRTLVYANDKIIFDKANTSAATFSHTPDKTTTYKLVVSNEGGSDSATSVVEVKEETVEFKIVSFYLKPAEVIQGEKTTAYWTISGIPSRIELLCTNTHQRWDVTGKTSFEITTSENLYGNFQYVLRAYRGSTSIYKNAMLTVKKKEEPEPPEPSPPEIKYFNFDKSTINAGDSATLSWKVVNAASVSLRLPNGQTVNKNLEGSTTINFPDPGTFEYTLSAYNEGKTDTATARITVLESSDPTKPQEPKIDYFYFTNTKIKVNASTTLVWKTSNANQVILKHPNLKTESLPSSGSKSFAFTQEGSYTYILTAQNKDGSVSKSASVSVEKEEPPPEKPDPVINVFVVNPAEIKEGESATFNWNTSYATSVRFEIPGMTSESVSLSGSRSITFTTAGTYTAKLTASNSTKIVVATATVIVSKKEILVEDDPTILSFTADKFEIEPNESVTLQWQVENADRVRLEPPGLDVFATDSYTTTLTTSTSFTLRAENSYGSDVKTVTVSVKKKEEPSSTNLLPWIIAGGGIAVGLIIALIVGLRK